MSAGKTAICQSCAMPMTEPKHFGTESGGSPSGNYCCFCRKDGRFTDDLTQREMIEKLVGFAPHMGMTEAEARAMAENIIPRLKRWRRA